MDRKAISLADLLCNTSSSSGSSLDARSPKSYPRPDFLRARLPHDILLEITRFLECTDVVRLSEVCTSLNRTCQSDVVWHHQAARYSVHLCEPHATTEKPFCSALAHVKSTLGAPAALMEGQYISTQKLARSAGFSRCVYTCLTMIADDPDNKRIACGQSNGSVRIYRVNDSTPEERCLMSQVARPTLTLQPDRSLDSLHRSTILSMDHGTYDGSKADGHRLELMVTGGADGNVVLINLGEAAQPPHVLVPPGGNEHGVFTSHSAPVTAVAMHPSFPLVATADEYGKIKLWNLMTREFIVDFQPHMKAVSALLWANALKAHSETIPVNMATGAGMLLTGSFDGGCALWDATAPIGTMHDLLAGNQESLVPRLVSHLLKPSEGAYRVYDITSSRNGQLVAVACGDGTVRIFEMSADASPRSGTVFASGLWVKTVCFTCYDTVLLAGGGDHRVHAWNVSSAIHKSNFGVMNEANEPTRLDTAGSAGSSTAVISSQSAFSSHPYKSTGSLRRMSSRGASMTLGSPQQVSTHQIMTTQHRFTIRYLGTLDIHAGPILQVRAAHNLIASISTDESLVLRRFLPTLLFETPELPPPECGQLFYIEDECHRATQQQLDGHVPMRPLPLFTPVTASCPMSPLRTPVTVVFSPVPACLSSTPPVISCTTNNQTSSSICAPSHMMISQGKRLSIADLPRHPPMPFATENAPAYKMSKDFKDITSHSKSPASAVLKQCSNLSSNPAAVVRMAGGAGAVAIFPAKLRRICWPQGPTYLDHVSTLIDT